jgi:uncharacterized protein YbbK (DUF523 family)
MADNPEMIYAVSACLLGIRCRYNGGHQRSDKVLAFLRDQRFIPVCPELLTGLPMPRPPAEIISGSGPEVLRGEARVKLADGTDVTEAFLRGAKEAMQWVQLAGATHALLKERSPSCGVRQIHQQGKVVEGQGVFAALLDEAGIKIVSEEEL